MMNSTQTIDVQRIFQIIQAINSLWQAKRYEEIEQYLGEEVVVAPPGSEQRVRGRQAYGQSYREFDQSAKTLQFSFSPPQVDVMGDVAVAVCPFFIAYELQGTLIREKGFDILVLTRTKDNWAITWRTMHSEPV